jgi:hypothetical protein
MLFWVLAALAVVGALAIVWVLYLLGCCTCWPAAGFSSEARAGVNAPEPSPARKWRARGRIEHTLLDGEFSVRPNRPKTFARNHTIPHKSAECFYLRQRAGARKHRPRY